MLTIRKKEKKTKNCLALELKLHYKERPMQRGLWSLEKVEEEIKIAEADLRIRKDLRLGPYLGCG